MHLISTIASGSGESAQRAEAVRAHIKRSQRAAKARGHSERPQKKAITRASWRTTRSHSEKQREEAVVVATRRVSNERKRYAESIGIVKVISMQISDSN